MKKIVFFCLLSINLICAYESVIDKIQVSTPQEQIAQPVIESKEIEVTDGEVDFDNLTDQMEESGIDFTIDEPSKLQLLLRKIGMHLVPLLPYYLAARKWTNQKLAWINTKQNECSMNLYTLLAKLTYE